MPTIKCTFCGKKINKADAYEHELHNKVKGYFCSKEEFNAWLLDCNKEADFLEEVNFLFDVSITIVKDSSWLDIKQAITTLRKTYTREEILWYLNNTLEKAVTIAERKTFDKEFYKIRYLLGILKGDIAEYLRDHPVPPPVTDVEVDYYMAPIKYKPSNQRRAMRLIEQLEGDDGDG